MGQTLITVTGTTNDLSQVVLLAGRGWSDENKCYQLKVFPYIDVVALRPRAGTLPAFRLVQRTSSGALSLVQLDRQGPGRVQQTLAGNGGLARVDPRKAWQGRLAVYYKAKFSEQR